MCVVCDYPVLAVGVVDMYQHSSAKVQSQCKTFTKEPTAACRKNAAEVILIAQFEGKREHTSEQKNGTVRTRVPECMDDSHTNVYRH